MSKMAVVTGGTKGIGKAIILKFASQKFDIVTCARHGGELMELKRDLQHQYAINVHVMVADLSVKGDVTAFTDLVASLNKPVDVLVNNAGFFIPGTVLDEKEGTLEKMIEGNVYSAYYTTRGVGIAMKAQKRGHIFNICSIASIVAYPNGGSYSISKFAMLGFSKVLREEMKQHGVRVTAVMPGATLTASWAGVDIPEDRFSTPEDVAEAVFGAYSLSGRSVVEEIVIRPQLGDI
jgi:short-subunit dehydrogenase